MTPKPDWLAINLESHIKILRTGEKVCRDAYKTSDRLKTYATELANCHALAAEVYERALKRHREAK